MHLAKWMFVILVWTTLRAIAAIACFLTVNDRFSHSQFHTLRASNFNNLDLNFLDGQLAYRGCNSDDPLDPGVEFCSKHSRECFKCPARGCNDNHPEIERKLSCYKCQGKDCILASNTTKPVLCDPFVTDYKNYCFTRVANGSVSRGCILEHNELQADCDSWFSTTCEECEGKDCNRFPILSETCVECDAKTDANCTNNPGANSKKLCPLHLRPLGCYRTSEDGRGMLNYHSARSPKVYLTYSPAYQIHTVT